MRAPAQFAVMGDDDDGGARVMQFFQQRHHLGAGLVVELAGGFVREQHRRVEDGGARDGDALALAARKLGRTMMGAVDQDGPFQRGLDARLPFRGRQAFEDQRQLDVLGRVETRHQVEGLEDEADALAPDLACSDSGNAVTSRFSGR